jgi:Zn-dependent protease with chaperone function
MGRSWRGVVGALVGTYFYLPFAIFMSALSAVVLGVVGFFGGLGSGWRRVPAAVLELPLLGEAVDAFLLRTSGVIGLLLGVLLGLVLGFVGALLAFWWLRFSEDPLAGFGWMLGVVAAGLFIGLVYTLWRVAFESWILRASGARRMSRRERELIAPIVLSCVQRLGLSSHPPILMDDGAEPNATAYTRHVVISRGLLDEFHYDPEVIGGVLCHELVHWRNGDPVSAVFVRGVALPLYLVHAGLSWLTRRVHSTMGVALLYAPLALLGWLVFWPVMITVRFVVMPLQAADTRAAELRADQGAVLAGYGDGLRQVLVRLRRSFEGGRNGWTAAVCATHPPSELRLERLEDPSRTYPLPDPEGASTTGAGEGGRQS